MNSTFDIIVPIRDNRNRLNDCLESFSGQKRPPVFRVVVIDDGSKEPIDEGLREDYPFPVKVVRQVPLGISAARNTGIATSEGDIILFVDSDVVLHADFMRHLAASIGTHQGDMAFQPALYGGKLSLVERMEGLRLAATMEALKDEGGRVRYTNTSAFAIRRILVDPARDFFDPGALRGEDTRVLTGMLRRGLVPRFVPDAHAFHLPRMPLGAYIRKHFQIGYHTAPSRDELRRECPEVLLGSGGRLGVFRTMLDHASRDPADLPALLLIGLAYPLERIGRFAHRLVGLRHQRNEVLGVPVDCIRENELLARMAACAARGQGMLVTYLTAWTLVQAHRDREMRALLPKFDICYPDGMGVVLCSLLLRRRRLVKVTANNFILKLCEQAEKQSLSLALVGASREVIATAARKLKCQFPALELVGYSHGYLSDQEDSILRERLAEWKPRIVVVGMGQPHQENWVLRIRKTFPNTVFLCVGGLFDYMAGVKPTPPLFIRRIGMEWLYILLLRPKQYWKRYVIGLPVLALLVLLEYQRKFARSLRAGESMKPQNDEVTPLEGS